MTRPALTPAILLLSFFSVVSSHSHADTYNVPAGDVLELLLAIDAANANPGYDKIVLPADSTYTIWAIFGEDYTGLPTISSYIEITAPDGEKATIRRPAGADASFRLFRVAENGTLRLDGITVSGGEASDAGAIKNYGTLIIERSTIADNTGQNSTGAIRNEGDLSMVDTTVIGNSSELSDVGGLLNVGNAVIERCTFSDNWANRGAGAIGNAGYLRAVNSTFSGNTADVGGGAIINNSDGDLWLESVTITNNTCDLDQSGGGDGGGIAGGGNIRVRNSIIAGNFDSTPQIDKKHPDVSCELFSHGYNLIGSVDGLDLVGDAATCLVGYEDLFLGPLAHNGGPTRTHKLLPGSPAIDNGNSSYPGSSNYACDTTDQRSYSRPADGDGNGVARCDIGAYERGGNAFLPPGGGKVIPPGDDDGDIDGKVVNPGDDGGREPGDGYVIVDLGGGDEPETPTRSPAREDQPEPSITPEKFRRGDVNASDDLDMGDAILLLNWLFLSGREPRCQKAADANDDGSLDVADVSRLLNFLYLGAAAPPAPNACGWDETKDLLTCDSYEPCTTKKLGKCPGLECD